MCQPREKERRLNAIAVPAAKKTSGKKPGEKKIVVVGDLDLGYRRATRFNEHQQQIYLRTVTMLELDRPSGRKLALMVPIMSPDAAFAAHILNRFDTCLVECESLRTCSCEQELEDVCSCLREHLTEPCFSSLLIIAPTALARAMTEALMKRLRRPKGDLIDLEPMVRHPLFSF